MDKNSKWLTVVDEYTGECLSIEVSSNVSSLDVIATFSRLMSAHGMPHYLRSDNGPEFVINALVAWAYMKKFKWHLLKQVSPGKWFE